MASQFPNGVSAHDGAVTAAGVLLSGTSMSHQPAAGQSASGHAFNVATGAVNAVSVSAQDGDDLTLAAGTSSGDHIVLVPNATDGEVQCSSRPITGATTITASGAITGGSLTDGTATLASGALSGATTVTASGAVTGGSLTDGTATLTSGALSGATTVTASGAITGGSLTDGTAMLTSGALSGVTTIAASGVLTAGGISSSADVNLNNNRIINVGDPSAATDAATKSYVDNEVGRISRKQPAETVVTTNLSATYDAGSNTLTADANGAFAAHHGVTATTGQVVLVTAQTAAWANGLYTVTTAGDGSTPFVLTRTDDMSEGDEVEGALVQILGGTYADTEWRAAVGASFVMHDESGDGDITWAQIQVNFVTAGEGLTKVGTSLSVDASNEAEMGADLADGDLLLVYDVSASATRGSVLSRVPTYINNHSSITSFSNLTTVGTVTSGTWNSGFSAGVVGTSALANNAVTNDKVASGIAFDKLSAPAAAFAMNNQRITGLGAPSATTDAATKTYVDTAVAGAGPSLGNFSFSGNTMTTSGTAVGVDDHVALGTSKHLILGTASGLRETTRYTITQFGGLTQFVSVSTTYVGIISLSSDTVAAETSKTFTFSNGAIADGAYIFLQLASGNAQYFTATVSNIDDGSANITLYNGHATNSFSSAGMQLMFWIVGPVVT